jgi:hypothetical protein
VIERLRIAISKISNRLLVVPLLQNACLPFVATTYDPSLVVAEGIWNGLYHRVIASIKVIDFWILDRLTNEANERPRQMRISPMFLFINTIRAFIRS